MKLNKNKLKLLISLVEVIIIVIPWQFLGSINPSIFWPQKVEAATSTITSRADFKKGYFSSTEADSTEGQVKLAGDGVWNARVWRTPYLTLTDGTTFASDGKNVYMVVGKDTRFVRYLPDEDRWQELASSPHMPSSGSDMVVVGNYVYVSFGGYQKEFSRYSISSNTWSDVASMPDLTFSGSSLQTDGTDIYALRGAATQDFWKYTVATNTWSSLTSTIATMSTGADLIYYSGALYTPRGGATTTMYKYTIGSGTWTTLTAAPGTLGDNGNITRKGTDIYVLRGVSTQTFYKYSIVGDSWTTLSNTPTATRYVGAVYSSAEDKIYIFRGNSTYDWWKYDTTSDSYVGPTDLPIASTTGSDLVYLNNNMYYRRGGSASFYGLNIATNVWTTLANSPAAFSSNDNKGASYSGSLYFYQGSNTAFYKYNVGGANWTTLATTPATVSNGGSISYPGTGNYLYGTRGAGTRTFWRYDIAGNTWDDSAVADLPVGAQINTGSRLVGDGQNIYAITGLGTSEIYQYNIGTDTWTLLGSVPFSPYYGTDAVYNQGKIYVQSGYYKTDLWEYTVATRQWRALPKMAGYYAQDIGPYSGGSLALDTSNSVLYSMNGGILRLQTFSLSQYNYPVTGTWTSGTIDLNYVNSFSALNTTKSTPSDSSLSLETRTSSDGVTFSSWQSVSGTSIASSANRYIQVRATFTSSSDRTVTPTLSDLSIVYSGDTTAPINPTGYTGLSKDIGGVALTSGNSYSYTHPQFSWSGASDTESTIAGYYVSFSNSSSDDPEIDGSFVQSTKYILASPLSTGKYYLRIKTKDSAGNISSAVTGFVYEYVGVSPAQTSTYTSSSDFSGGTETNVTSSNNEIKLQGQAGFWQQKRLSIAPSTFSYGASLTYVESNGKLYTFRGNNTTTFYSYDIATDTWTTLANAPATVYQGGDLVAGPSGYLYGTRGQNTSSFWRYDIANDTWSDAAASDPPSTLYYGSSIMFDGGHYIYALRGNSDDAFYRYDTDNDTWDSLANADFGAPTRQPNNNVYIGGDVAYNSVTHALYAIQGNSFSGFSSYDTSTNTWSQLPNLPVLPYDGAQIAYDSGTDSVIYISGWTNPFMYKYNISSQTWTKLPDAPATMGTGTSLKDVNGILYVLRGITTATMWEFDISKNSWLVPTVGLFGTEFRGTDYRPFGYGAQIQKGDGDNYYIVRGNYDNLMVRYNGVTGESTQMADIPYGLYSGSSFAYDSINNKLYLIPSVNTQKLLSYDIATDTWNEETSDPPPAVPGTGASLEYDGSRYIYWIRGAGTASLYRYDTQATVGSRWSVALANAPATLTYGAHLVFKGGYLYTLRGSNVTPNPLYKYDPSANSWATLANLNAKVYNDGFLVDGGDDNLYACIGGNSQSCYEYSITGDAWSSIGDAPANIYQGGAGAGNKVDRMYVIAGAAGTNTYANGLYTYVEQTSSSSFVSSGSYISNTIDYQSVYKYADLSLTYSAPSNTTITPYTRSSSDGTTWDGWNQVDNLKINGTTYSYNINSEPKRYLQVKFDLTSGDNVYSGVVSDYSVSYFQDTNAPVNPTLVSAYSTSTQSANLTTGNWYNFSSPYFSWPQVDASGGATDGAAGSGVAGYYVYFGTNILADPATDGTLQTTTNLTAPSLVPGSTYYLRIKTIDEAGNISPTAWQPYIYKYDNVVPENPTTVTADPSGYTATNNFAFAWSGATDDASGIADYCYKTRLGGTETCGVTTASISGVLADGTGASTFYIRARDNAGNLATSYSSVSYYYSSTAPSAPQNLSVNPASNTTNQFSFSWSPPAIFFGSQSSLRYFYSVNAIPTAQNVNALGLSATNLPTDSYATVPGANIMYVVAKDEAGNIDYNNYASVAFTADTSAPGIPNTISIADLSDKATSAWSLVIKWAAPEASGSGVSTYKLYSSAIPGAVCTTNFSDFSLLGTINNKSYVDGTGEGAENLTQEDHYYCVKACDSTSNCSAPSSTVHMYPTGKYLAPADLTASPSATVKTKSADISWSTSRTSNSFVKYGTSSGNYSETEAGSSAQVTSHLISLPNLAPGTTYYYVVSWTDEDGNLGTSGEQTFTTNPAPYISTVKVTNISLYSALINFTVKNTTSANIKYGKTLSYGGTKSISTSKDEATYTVDVDSLTEGTVYNLQIDAEDEEGNIFSSDNYSFETLPVPKIIAAKTRQIPDQPTATFQVLWITNTLASSILTYYPTDNPAAAQDQISLVLTRNHQMVLKNLKDDTDYTLLVKGKDSAGNEALNDPIIIRTASDLRPPVISNLSVESTISGVGDEAKAQIIVSWDTDEPSTTQVEYGDGTGDSFGQTTQEDTNLTLNHTVTVSGLAPAKIYHLRAKSKDKAKNVSNSSDNVVVTPRSTQSAFNLVIENLSKTFGFLKALSQ